MCVSVPSTSRFATGVDENRTGEAYGMACVFALPTRHRREVCEPVACESAFPAQMQRGGPYREAHNVQPSQEAPRAVENTFASTVYYMGVETVNNCSRPSSHGVRR